MMLSAISRTFTRDSEMMRLLHGAGELVERFLASAEVMDAKLKETRRSDILSRDDSIVVNLQPRPSKPVASYGAAEALDFQLDADYEKRWVDDRTETPARRRGLCNRSRNFAG
jgi:hypothetical protein